MSGRVFVDTNVLVYAHDAGAGQKHQRAMDLIEDLWVRRAGVISTQVLQELYVNVRRKAAQPISPDEARRVVADYLRWEVFLVDGDAILAAIDLEARYRVSFWDALIIRAALASGADTLVSEDLSHGQSYDGVRVENPFL